MAAGNVNFLACAGILRSRSFSPFSQGLAQTAPINDFLTSMSNTSTTMKKRIIGFAALLLLAESPVLAGNKAGENACCRESATCCVEAADCLSQDCNPNGCEDACPESGNDMSTDICFAKNEPCCEQSVCERTDPGAQQICCKGSYRSE